MLFRPLCLSVMYDWVIIGSKMRSGVCILPRSVFYLYFLVRKPSVFTAYLFNFLLEFDYSSFTGVQIIRCMNEKRRIHDGGTSGLICILVVLLILSPFASVSLLAVSFIFS
jgi:hypothetical protein